MGTIISTVSAIFLDYGDVLALVSVIYGSTHESRKGELDLWRGFAPSAPILSKTLCN